MKINEVEALVGITKKNIRFYEAEGLVAPRRNSDNGYRDYGEADVTALRQIKLLRKLGLPLEEIRALRSGRITVIAVPKEPGRVRLRQMFDTVCAGVEVLAQLYPEYVEFWGADMGCEI